MKKNHNLRVEVYANHSAIKPLLVREIYLELGDPIPYLELASAIRFLYGSESVFKMSSSVISNM